MYVEFSVLGSEILKNGAESVAEEFTCRFYVIWAVTVREDIFFQLNTCFKFGLENIKLVQEQHNINAGQQFVSTNSSEQVERIGNTVVPGIFR